MKKLLLLLFIINFSIVSAQDKEPTPWNFIWGYSTMPRPFEVDSFPQESILTGFQWSGSARMNNALLNNTMASAVYQEPNGTVNRKLNLIFFPTWQSPTTTNPNIIILKLCPSLS